MDGMNFGEKKVFSIPNNATFLKAIIIDEDNRLLLNESLHDNFSQLVSILMLLTLSHTVFLKFSIVRNLIGHSNRDKKKR